MKSEILLRKSIRNWTLLFITALILSGGTAFGLESELAWLDDYFLNTIIHFPSGFIKCTMPSGIPM